MKNMTHVFMIRSQRLLKTQTHRSDAGLTSSVSSSTRYRPGWTIIMRYASGWCFSWHMANTRSSSRVLPPARKAFWRQRKRRRHYESVKAACDGGGSGTYVFEQGQDVEREQTQAGGGQQAGLLDGQHWGAVGRQRVDGCVDQSVTSVTQTRRHGAIHGWSRAHQNTHTQSITSLESGAQISLFQHLIFTAHQFNSISMHSIFF